MGNETWPLGLSKEAQSFLDWLTSEDKEKIISVLLKDKETQAKKEKLKSVIQDLKDNCIKTNDYEINHRKLWKQIHLNLPTIWDFWWFKFDCFVSSGKISWPDFNRAWFDNYSYSMKEIIDLYDNLRKYLSVCWINDKNIDVNKIVQDIFSLHNDYRLSDLWSNWRSVVRWTYSSLSFGEYWNSDDFVSANLLLKMNEKFSVLNEKLDWNL